MEKPLANFIRTNNAVPIAFSLVVFLAAGTFAASPEVRDGIAENLVSSQSVIQSVDNTQLLAADMAGFEFRPQIIAVTEDSENYYIEYSYGTFLLEDFIWLVKDKFDKLTVDKDALGNRDLGDYVAEELKEVIDYERSYLADTQNIEKINGATQKVVTTTYSGLIGKFFDEKQEVFAGYEAVVKAPVLAAVSTELPQEQKTPEQTVSVSQPASEEITAEYIRSIVQEMLAQSSTVQNQENTIDGTETSIPSQMAGESNATTTQPAENSETALEQEAIPATSEVATTTSEISAPTAAAEPPITPMDSAPAESETEVVEIQDPTPTLTSDTQIQPEQEAAAASVDTP